MTEIDLECPVDTLTDLAIVTKPGQVTLERSQRTHRHGLTPLLTNDQILVKMRQPAHTLLLNQPEQQVKLKGLRIRLTVPLQADHALTA
ncbi:hypothetical protein D3C78_913740 [compost metagenome]